ncbi:hypothetical protein IFM89_035728 [Coptis chinensis]|uniref:F-box domain-containing protein n=1 Tax=Coptis chinensis TaxID=261450 RepID=A0A835GZW9_9MAGN|nr:hypothetical protein IFM89_035728 [Coptis chinensis]
MGMDETGSTSSFKTLKLFGGQSCAEGEDRISSLPDEILHLIFSFMPTVDAVRSCVLSTRWKYLWTSIPYLDFSNRKRTPKDSFLNFVDRVLSGHDASEIQKFCLQYEGVYNVTRINEWISTVMRHKLQELDLDIRGEESFTFRHCLSHFESLTILKVKFKSVLPIPASFLSSSLRIVRFVDVCFSSDQLGQQVSFNLPVVEEFLLSSCFWPKIRIVKIYAPSLKKLVLVDWDYDGDPNFETEIKVEAKSLSRLSFVNDLAYDYSLSIPSVAFASVHVGIVVHPDNCRLLKFLANIYTVKALRLGSDTIQTLSRADIFADLQMFSNLTKLEVLVNGQGGFSGKKLLILLACMPNVESLDIVDDLQILDDAYFPGWTHEKVSECFLSHLKSVKLERFVGSENVLCLLGFLLKNAGSLEKMTVISSSKLSTYPKKQMEVSKQLLMLPRDSKCCVIDFS